MNTTTETKMGKANGDNGPVMNAQLRFEQARATLCAHRGHCATCAAAHEAGEPTDCPTGDELLVKVDHFRLDAEDARASEAR